MKVTVLAGAVFSATLALASAAQAAIMTYTNQAAFTAATPNAQVETFSVAPAPGRTGSPATYDFGDFTAEKQYSEGNTGPGGGVWRGKPTTTQGDIFSFDNDLFAWGAFFNTQEGGNGNGIVLSVQIDLLLGNTVVGTVGAGPDANNAFLGLTSDTPFNNIRILTVTGNGDTYTLDNMRYAVPEPGTLALLGAGLLGMAGLRRRRKAS